MRVRGVLGILIAALLLLGGCAEEPETIRLLSLGDSYTIGQGVVESERWPNQLARALEAEGSPPVEVRIVAQTGWTTSDLDAGIDAAAPEGPFDLVTLLVGVNNQFRGLDPDEYRAEFAALLERAAGFSKGPVLVVSIPDWGVTPLGGSYDRERVALEIDEFNAIARSEAEAAGAEWVYVTPISRSDIVGLVAADALHPSGLQYGLWVEEILPVARQLLDG
jgi:lysophospholipase L1-like esterase